MDRLTTESWAHISPLISSSIESETHISFKHLEPAWKFFKYHLNWPTLDDYNQAFDFLKIPYNVAEQMSFEKSRKELGLTSLARAELYCEIISDKNLIPTRSENWHDFFNLLMWLTFPTLKAKIHQFQFRNFRLQSSTSFAPGRGRPPINDILTIFDEGGSILAIQEERISEVLELIGYERPFEERRMFFLKNSTSSFSPLIFGHGIYDCLVGGGMDLSSLCVLLPVKDTFFALNKIEQVHLIDQGNNFFWNEDLFRNKNKMASFWFNPQGVRG